MSRRADGTLRDLAMRNSAGTIIRIHTGLDGGQRVESTEMNGARIVADGPDRGYVEASYMFNGSEFVHRTYSVDGHAYDRFYRQDVVRGAAVDAYTPARYCSAAFYSWAYYPWNAPAISPWGWPVNPAGPYFKPSVVYPGASSWLTDYLVSRSLEGSYRPQISLSPTAAEITPEVKEAIADEIQRYIRLENGEAIAKASNFGPPPGTIGRPLSENASHVFLVGAALDLIDTAGKECAVSRGDVLQLNPPVSPVTNTATLTVIATRGGLDCGPGLVVTVSYADLQEMQNYMREILDAGFAVLQAHENGLPTPPPSATEPQVAANFANASPGPDPSAADRIERQYRERQHRDDAVRAIPAPLSPLARLYFGMTGDQVINILGQPKNIFVLNSKQVYIYPEVKVTFVYGRVSKAE
jgi:hypothetical protein